MATKKHETSPLNASTPGEVLKNELKSRGISQREFAAIIGVQPSHLNEVIKGKREMTSQMADLLEGALHIPSIQWTTMQAEYEYQQKMNDRQNQADQEALKLLQDFNTLVDLHTLFERLGLARRSSKEQLDFCMEQLGFANLNQTITSGHWHKSEKTGMDQRMIATWAILARYTVGKKTVAGTFDRTQKEALCKELCAIFNENQNTIVRVGDMLSQYGIRFCVVEKVEKASIDGYSFLGDDGVPAIVVTKRFDRIDNFAFAVLHELGHIYLHITDADRSRLSLAPSIDDNRENREERAANEFAANTLISPKDWKTAPQVQPIPYLIQASYTLWASQHGYNKWIVLGRISYETGMYKFRNDSSRAIA